MWLDDALPPHIVEQLEAHRDKADIACEERRYGDAIAEFSRAFKLPPAPPHQWAAASWLLIAIGDAAYLSGDIAMADEAFRELVREGRGWNTSPLCWLRRGQIAFDRGDEKQATACLASAFMLAGYDIFSREDEKYAKFVLAQMDSSGPPVEHPLAKFHRDRICSEHRPWWKIW